MKKISYIKYLLFREWLPIIIIFTALLLIVNFSFATSVSLYSQNHPSQYFYEDFQGTTSFTIIIWFIMAFVMSFVIFSYRFSTKRSDTFYQVPLKPGELKNIRFITGLIVVAVVMLVTFIIPYLAFVIRYVSSPDIYIYTYYSGTFYKNYINLGMMFVSFLVALGATLLEYCISSYFFSLCHKPASAVLINITFHAFIAFFLATLFALIGSRIYDANHSTDTTASFNIHNASMVMLAYSPGFTLLIDLPKDFFFKMAFQQSFLPYLESIGTFATVVFYIMIGAHVLLGAIGCTLLLLKKEKSGEYCNKYGFANSKLNQLFFITMIPFIFMFAALHTSYIISFYFVFIIIAGTYYFLFALFSGTFKVQKSAYIYIGVMVLLLFILPPFFDQITGVGFNV